MRRVVVAVALVLLVAGTVAAQRIDVSSYPMKRIPEKYRDMKGLDLVLNPVDARAAGGPDGFGYYFADSTEVGGPTYSWVDITGTGTAVPGLGDDDSDGPFNIGFTFPFYGVDQTQFYIGSNGYITFGAGSTDLGNDCGTGYTSTPNDIIALMWDDLYPNYDTGGVYYQTFAACPVGSGQCLVVEFLNWAHCCSSTNNAGTWQAILYDDGEILLQYQDAGIEEGSSSTTGIENADGSVHLTYACNTPGSITDGLAVLYSVPALFSDLEVTKTASSDTIGVGQYLTYTIDVVNQGPDAATGVVVEDTLPGAVTYVSDTCGAIVAGSDLTWTIGAMAVSGTASCDVTVQLDSCAWLMNTAGVGGDNANPGDNFSTVDTNQLVDDPSFEGGTPNPFWTEASTTFGTPLCDPDSCGGPGPNTGDWWAWYGGTTAVEAGSVSQSVVIPTAATTLDFYLWVWTHSGNGASDYFQVLVDGNEVFRVDDTSAAYDAGYTLVQADISAYADGAAHTIELRSEQIGGGYFNVMVDDVSLVACEAQAQANADLAITKTGSATGTTGSFVLTVTNNGPDAASGVVVTDPLPAGLTYVSNDCGASYAAPNVTWNVGTLASGASDQCTIQVVVTDPNAISNTATVSGPVTDPTPSNNTSTFVLQIQATPIPVLGGIGAIALVLLLAGAAVLVLRSRLG